MLKFVTRALAMRVVVPIALIVTVMALITVVSAAKINLEDGRTSLEDRANVTTNIIAGGLTEALWNVDKESATSQLAALGNDPDYVSSKVVDPKGVVFASHGNAAASGALILVRKADVVRKADGRSTVLGSVEVRLSAARAEKQALERATMLAIAGFLALVAVCGVLFWIVRGATKPIVQLTATMSQLAAGDTATIVPSQERSDEIGRMAAAVQVFKEHGIEKQHLQAEQERMRQRAESDRRAAIAGVADNFERQVSSVMAEVCSTANQMGDSTRLLSAAAERNGEVSQRAAGNAASVNSGVDSMAAAVEQLAASIREISSQAQRSQQIAGEASVRANRAEERVAGLVQAADKVNAVVTLINSIASQTNLLALNATIEAARAGEAGKGFAVVAGEVKALANQTAKATEEIESQIRAIQDSTGAAASEITEIAKVVSSVSEISASIAAAVEEQNAATGEIGRGVNEAAQGVRALLGDVNATTSAAEQTGDATGRLRDAMNTLQSRVNAMQAQVGDFVGSLRRA
ncbi:HAMP domain-containing protein [Azospirillum cavernae]|uniref:HAMP domain-containing protein n=1 Tax=Azospirillum cavernae TaxID=2320860 RepID=A0A418VS98_9PROT|nr:methyl-accepting chemotaxis protein [Azospirillum cavernae]RJF79364.1 HAMP domain-containing protein [Azospirillum cavernae]